MVGTLVRLGTLLIVLLKYRAASDHISCPCTQVRLYSTTCDQQCQKQQRQALERLYNAWGGAEWYHRQGWLSNSPHCSWEGVSCCPGNDSYLAKPGWHDVNGQGELVDLSRCCCATPGAVSALQLPSNNVVGHISALLAANEISNTLLVINLRNNSLHGTFTSHVSHLQVLHGLYLDSNALQGIMPAALGNLTNLKVLNAASNLLTGSVPTSRLLQLQRLESLVLDNNRLTGTVPLDLLLLPKLKRIQVSSNQLSGHLLLPLQLAAADTLQDPQPGDIFRLRVLNVKHNQVSGSLPPALLEMVELSLDLSSNNISGSLPAFNNKALQTLRVANNSLTGSLPDVVGAGHLLELDVSGNMLHGTLPAWLTHMSDLVVLRFDDNKGLVGTVPEALVSQQHLALLDGRGTRMQQPKYFPPGSDDTVLTAVPAWMQLHMVTPGGSAAASSTPGTPNCPFPGVRGKELLLKLDPYYFQFEGCQCPFGQMVYTMAANHSAVTGLQCDVATPQQAIKTWRLVLYILLPILSVALVVCFGLPAYADLRNKDKSAADLLKVKKKRVRPPQEGQPLTLVMTDVADSTALWEWNPVQAAQATEQHDKIMRDYLSMYCGYEVTTEGDAFLVAFHEPGDAIAYCLTVQLALQYADWSKDILEWSQQRLPPPPNHRAVADSSPHLTSSNSMADHGGGKQQHIVRVQAAEAETSSSDSTQSVEAVQEQLLPYVPPATDLFKGLRVRMAVACGVADGVKLHKVTGRVEYWGHVMQKVQALAEAPEGGQVLMDSETFRGINTRLPQMGARIMAALAAKGWLLPATMAPKIDDQHRRAPVSINTEEHAMGSIVALALTQQDHPNSAVPIPCHSHPPLMVASPCPAIPEGHDAGSEKQLTPISRRADCDHAVLMDTPVTWGIASKQAMDTCQPAHEVQHGSSNSGLLAVMQPTATGCDSQPVSSSFPSLTAVHLQGMSFSSLLAASGASFTAVSHRVIAPMKQGPAGRRSWQCSNDYSHGSAQPRSSHPAGTASQAKYFFSQQHTGSADWSAGAHCNSTGAQQCSRLKNPGNLSTQKHAESSGVCAGSPPGCEISLAEDDTANKMPQQQLEQRIIDEPSGSLVLDPVPTRSADNTALLLSRIDLHQLGTQDKDSLNAETGLQHQIQPSVQSDDQYMDNLLIFEDTDEGGERDVEAIQLAVPGDNSRQLIQPSTIGSMGTAVDNAPAAQPQSQGLHGYDGSWQQQTHLSGLRAGDQSALDSIGCSTLSPACYHTEPSTLQRPASSLNKLRSLVRWSATSLLPTKHGHGHRDAGRHARRNIDPIWNSQNGTIQSQQAGGTAVTVLDMGIHKLSGHAEPIQLVVALPPGLEARANHYALLSTLQQQTPGYLDAPGASASPLSVDDTLRQGQSLNYCNHKGGHVSVPRSICQLPPVVMVFCAVDGYHDMLLADRPAAEDLLQQYADVVRWTLLVAGGYECQEQEGNYMIAFDAADAALEWALLVQEALLEVAWTSQILALPGAAEVVCKETGTIQFRGPRVRIGIYRGIPTRVVPHSTTGRADYFGPLVNRAARYCHTAAHAGQVVAARELVDELVEQWCDVDPATLLEDAGPPWNLQLQATPHDQRRACWARCPQPRGVGNRRRKASMMVDSRASVDHTALPADLVLSDESSNPTVACRREVKRCSGSICSTRSHARLEDDHPARTSLATLRRSITLVGNADTPFPGNPSSSGSIHEAATHGGLKLSLTPSMRRVLLVPQDASCDSLLQPVPDLLSLATLRRVAADQLQQQQEEEGASSTPAGFVSTGVAAHAITQTASAGLQLEASATYKRLSVSSRRTMTRTESNATYASRTMSGSFDLDSGLAAALYARLVLHRWKWADTLLVHDIGEYTFKGINGSHSLVSVTTKALAGRSFPHRLRKSKGEQITKGKGLLYELQVLAASGGQQVQQQDA